jgi:hypothetical protein
MQAGLDTTSGLHIMSHDRQSATIDVGGGSETLALGS